MDLFLVRHGQAQDCAPNGRDRERRLTQKGWAQARAVGEFFVSSKAVPDLVLSSPIMRAHETAQGIMAAAQMPGEPILQEWLGFGMDSGTTMKELAALPEEIQRVVLVGHEPSFSAMAEWLLGTSGAFVEVKKASVLRFQLHPPSRRHALLKMLLPAKILLG